MKNVSNTLSNKLDKRFKQSSPPHGPVEVELKFVAEAFVELQQQRHTADYDNARVWSSTEAENTLLTAAEVYRKWSSIKNTDMAREYPLDMLGGNR
jgi:hypothetical protein